MRILLKHHIFYSYEFNINCQKKFIIKSRSPKEFKSTINIRTGAKYLKKIFHSEICQNDFSNNFSAPNFSSFNALSNPQTQATKIAIKFCNKNGYKKTAQRKHDIKRYIKCQIKYIQTKDCKIRHQVK